MWIVILAGFVLRILKLYLEFLPYLKIWRIVCSLPSLFALFECGLLAYLRSSCASTYDFLDIEVLMLLTARFLFIYSTVILESVVLFISSVTFFDYFLCIKWKLSLFIINRMRFMLIHFVKELLLFPESTFSWG